MNDWIKVEIKRDSVCAGDDIDGEHKKILKLYPDESVEILIDNILKINYLPTIAGGKATWVVRSNNINIAVLAEQWNKAKYFISSKLPLSGFEINDNLLKINIEYYTQLDPDYIFNEINIGNKPKKW